MNTIPREKLPVAEEIKAMMATIIAASENADVEKTFSFLTRDTGGIFFLNNQHHKLESLLSLFHHTYGKMQRQHIRIAHAEVIVFGPEAAMWIGYGEGRMEPKAGGLSMTYSFTETWIWQKIRGKWVVTHYHESSG